MEEFVNRNKIFIIEDESIIARDLESVLSGYDYNVSGIFANAEDAISKITENNPDLVLMDITLRGNIDGIEAAKRIKKEYSLPVIFLTAFDDDATLKKMKDINHDGYLVKPFEEEKLSYFVQNALSKNKNGINEKDKRIKYLENRLNEAVKELEQFSYIASHDLQEPLRMIASYVQLLQKRYGGKLDPEADEFINFAVDGSKRMKNIINDLLTYSNISVNTNFETVDLNIIAAETINTLKTNKPGSKISVKYSELPAIFCNKAQMQMLFYNLIDNAAKFNNNIPEISIDYSKDGNTQIFSVKDNGIGIDENYSGTIFEIFRTLNNRKEYPGTGAGLAICRKIAENHGGNIWFTSSQGVGSTFYFSIPVNQDFR